LAICGGGDPIVRDSERLGPAWRRHGGDGEVKLYGDAFHAFHAFVWTPLARAAWADQHAFLERSLAG
jgi:acetyl esterase/lipase